MLGNRLSQQPWFRAKTAKTTKKLGRISVPSFVSVAFFARLNLVVLLALAGNLRADDARFLGSKSCSTSGCHGGADDKHNQYVVWSKYDVHHERPYATLTTARSERIAQTLKIDKPTESARCTVCHAPMQTVPGDRRAADINISEGVSCESCHGPAENWIRSHTRKDYTHADRIHAGMRDLENLYIRANTCVACHQNVDADILAAGHPELIFELDGQCVTEPKHWRETTNWNGAQAWLVGQAVALREMKWQSSGFMFSKAKAPLVEEENAMQRANALFWLAQKVATADNSFPPVSFLNTKYGSQTIQEWSDKLAQSASALPWTDAQTRKCLASMAETSGEFRTGGAGMARRAERLVLALDRLITALPELDKNDPVQAALKQLFKDAQSQPDFNPTQFADHLAEFQKTLPVWL